MSWRGRNFFRGLFLLPWITSTVIIALTWRWMFDAFPGRGFFNSVLLDAGLLQHPMAFMATPEGAMAAVIVANWWRGFPFFGVSYLAGMQAIPRELYDAASVDGAGPWRRFWHITLPGLKHVLVVTSLLSFILTINDFNIIYVMTRGGPGHGHAGVRHLLLRGRLQPAALGARGDDRDLPRARCWWSASRWSAGRSCGSGTE